MKSRGGEKVGRASLNLVVSLCFLSFDRNKKKKEETKRDCYDNPWLERRCFSDGHGFNQLQEGKKKQKKNREVFWQVLL